MGRGFDFTVVGVIIIIAYVMHLIGINLFQPGSPLYEVAAGASHFNAQAKADLWFEILTVWMPLLASGGIIAWAVIREYRRQVATAARPLR